MIVRTISYDRGSSRTADAGLDWRTDCQPTVARLASKFGFHAASHQDAATHILTVDAFRVLAEGPLRHVSDVEPRDGVRRIRVV